MFRKIHKNSYLPFLAAKWTGVYKNLPKVNENKFTSFQLFFLAAKWSGVYKNLPFWTSHISYGSKIWTLILKQKILKLLFDVLHFILLPLCGCFTNKFIIKTRKSLVILIFVLICFEWGSNCFLKSINSAESWPFPSVWKELSKV